MPSQESRVLRLLEPLGEPDIIECGARVLFPHPWLGSKEEG